jgi:hypothetical protein
LAVVEEQRRALQSLGSVFGAIRNARALAMPKNCACSADTVCLGLKLEMSCSGRSRCAVSIVVIVGLLFCLPSAKCDALFLPRGEAALQHSSSNAIGSGDDAVSVPCDGLVDLHANVSGASACPGGNSVKANRTLHISYLQKQVSRLVRFPGSNERRHLNALQDYVYVRDTPEADALVGDALDASIGGDVYSFGANEVNFFLQRFSSLNLHFSIPIFLLLVNRNYF